MSAEPQARSTRDLWLGMIALHFLTTKSYARFVVENEGNNRHKVITGSTLLFKFVSNLHYRLDILITTLAVWLTGDEIRG